MNSFWSIWVIVLTVVTIAGILWLLLANRKIDRKDADQKTGHEYDGIEEYDNPLPAWWMYMFLLSILFGIVYLIAYPGMGDFKGMLDWTQEKQFEKEVAKSEAEFIAVYNGFSDKTVEGLAANEKAVKMGQRLFSNNCSVCHGSDAGGAKGYPNLRDKDWLYGGSGEQIKLSITDGRQGAMPPWSGFLDDTQIKQLAVFVKSLSQGKHDDASVVESKTSYQTFCAACHGATGEGGVFPGAPVLADNIWLYGGSLDAIEESIRNGRSGKMPAHADLLTEERIQLISGYVYSLSQ